MARFWFGIILASWAGGVLAQQAAVPAQQPPLVNQASSVLTLDVERLFSQSQFGTRILDEFNAQAEAFGNENRRIADALREEELELARQRPNMAIEVFLAEAEAFDEKAQAIRRAQDAKERELENFVTVGREQFLAITRPILGDLMVENGATAILDRRSIYLSLSSADITDAAIAQVDLLVGDGTSLEVIPDTPEPVVED